MKHIELEKLDPLHFKLFLQFLNLSGAFEKYSKAIPYDRIYANLKGLKQDFITEILNADKSVKTEMDVKLKLKSEFDEQFKSIDEFQKAQSKHFNFKIKSR